MYIKEKWDFTDMHLFWTHAMFEPYQTCYTEWIKTYYSLNCCLGPGDPNPSGYNPNPGLTLA